MSVEIKNYYRIIPDEYKQSGSGIKYKNYSKIQIPVPFRMLVVGASGAGKTNVIMNLIQIMSCFTKIYLFAKNLTEPLYAYLIDKMNKLSKKLKREVIFVSNDVIDMPDIDEIDTDESNLFIFDDMVTEAVTKQKAISDLFVRGRKSSCSAIYITQSYFSTPSLVRKNCDFIILKKINTKRDLTAIIREYNLDDITVDDLLKMYKKIVGKGLLDFLMIDLNTNDPDLKFRWNFESIKKLE